MSADQLRASDPQEKICQQIELLAEISKRKNTPVSEIVECSKAMVDLYKVLKAEW